MARMPRVAIPGYPHHITQRGNYRQKTFFCEEDYRYYIELLARYSKVHGTAVWAYYLMPNHVHLVLVPEKEDGLRVVLNETHRHYTRRINFRAGWRGHLWQERIHSFVKDEPYLLATVRYVERNPVVANTGKPLGSDDFVGRLEGITGRVLRPKRPGRKAKNSDEK